MKMGLARMGKRNTFRGHRQPRLLDSPIAWCLSTTGRPLEQHPTTGKYLPLSLRNETVKESLSHPIRAHASSGLVPLTGNQNRKLVCSAQ